MKLVIKRSQSDMKGVFGGHKGVSFSLYYRLDLTPEERQLVERCRLEDYPVTWTTYQGTRVPDDTIEKMVLGRTQTISDVTTLVSNEETVKTACDSLPVLFRIVRTFGGEEVVEYPRDAFPSAP